jgi:WD40 repeat protein
MALIISLSRALSACVVLVRACVSAGVLMATASMDKTIRVWDAFAAVSDAPGGCVATLRDHTEAVMDVRWNADNTRLLSGSFDKTALLTDLETCTPIHVRARARLFSLLRTFRWR